MSLFVAADVARRVREQQLDGRIGVLWLAIEGEREPFKCDLDALLSDLPVLVLVVRSRGFDEPNALLADIVSILNEFKAHCEERLAAFPGSESLHIILLAKKQLAIAQASSPVMLPSWFPILPNRIVHAVVKDETWRLDAAVNDPRTGIPDLNAAVYNLETALLRRLRARMTSHPASGDSLWAQLDTPPATNLKACVEAFEKAHRAVANPGAFRPSLGAGDSLVAQVWRLIQRHGTEQIGKPGAALANSLGVTDDLAAHWTVHFTGLLFRPTSRQPASKVFGADVVLATAFACQMSTAAAHADQYPGYPVPLLTSFGQMLLTTLSEATVLVDSLD